MAEKPPQKVTNSEGRVYAPVDERFLAEGSYGVVWKARDQHGIIYAVKRLKKAENPDGTIRTDYYEHEKRMLGLVKELRSPHLIRWVEGIEKASKWHLVMEFAEGGSLRDRIRYGPYYSHSCACGHSLQGVMPELSSCLM
jgi:serine/threonine protein kinase